MIDNIQINAAENYLEARRTFAAPTIHYNYKRTYNYIFRKQLNWLVYSKLQKV